MELLQIKADRFYASGYKNKQLTLSIRKWKCPICKAVHDRDKNASKNLYKIGVAYLTKHPAVKQEALLFFGE